MISRKYPSTRLRRLRQSESIIDLTSECAVTKNDLIQPVFVKEGLSDKEPIESMPGIFRFGEDSVLKEIEEISRLGIRAIAIFPVIDPSKKDSKGTEAIKRDNFKPNKELPKKGVLSKYSKSVQSASLGAITD